MACHICSSADVREVPEYRSLTRVTSDCKAWPIGGHLAICGNCGSVQKVIDEGWQDEIGRIYGGYTIYHQAGGAEQAVFAGDSGQPMFRSDRLVQRISEHIERPPTGRLLDVGCGNGAFLRAVSRAWPEWRLAGTEWSDATRATVEAIPGVDALYTGAIADVPGQFDIVSMIHALEHIARPLEMLDEITGLLKPGGLLFVEIPNAAANPFDLLVADHASHFSPATLAGLFARAGFELVTLSTEWVTKEMSVLARPRGTQAGRTGPLYVPRCEPHAAQTDASTDAPTEAPTEARDEVLEGLEWLLAVRSAALESQRAAGDRGFGLFGSSIAATWLRSEVGADVRFFVDEDPSRRGQHFMDRLVLAPPDVPAGSSVFVGLGGGLSERVAARLSASLPDVSWVPAPARAPR